MKLKNSRQSELFIRPQTEFFFPSNMLITTAEAKKCEHYRTLKHGVLIYFFHLQNILFIFTEVEGCSICSDTKNIPLGEFLLLQPTTKKKRAYEFPSMITFCTLRNRLHLANGWFVDQILMAAVASSHLHVNFLLHFK